MKILKPSEVLEFIENALRCIPPEIPYVAGPPGIGKSELNAQIAEMFNLKLVTQHLSQKLPEDLTGLPRFNPETNKAEYTPFDVFPMAGDPLPLDENGDEMNGWLVFLDELADAPDEILSAIYPLLLGHTVGGRKLHEKALLCGAGNRATDSAMARELPDTLITRMLICEMKVSPSDWVDWGRSLPDDKKNERVIEFIEKNTDMLLSTKKSEDRDELESFGTPRGWSKAMSIVNLHERRMAKVAQQAGKEFEGAPLTDVAKHMLEAAVGTMETRQFVEFYEETLKIPYAWDIAQAPASAIIPPTTLGKAQVTSGLAEYYAENLGSTTSCDNILQYMNRMPSENAAVFADMLKEKLPQTSGAKEKLSHVVKVLGVNIITA